MSYPWSGTYPTRGINTRLGGPLRLLISIRLAVITTLVLAAFLHSLTLRSALVNADAVAPETSVGGRVVEPSTPGPPGGRVETGTTAATPDAVAASVPSRFLSWLAIAAYIASFVYLVLLGPLQHYLEIHAYLQLFGDLLLITGLVYAFGGVANPFGVLYLIVIATAVMLLRRSGGIAIATAAWLFYATVSLALHQGWMTTIGTTIQVTTARLLYSLGVNLIGFYGVALLTSRLSQQVDRTESELRSQIANLQGIHEDVIRSIPSGLITTDPEGVVTSINRAAEEILRLDDGIDLTAAHVIETDLFSADEWHSYAQQAAGPETRRHEVEQQQGDERRVIGFSVTELARADDQRAGYIVIFQDLSDWRRLQQELQMKDRMAVVGELAAGLAHEIGNPLAAIYGSCQMLASTFKGDAKRSNLLDILLKESQRLDRTIKGFLQFARPKERASVRFDIGKLLHENVELLLNSPEVLEHHAIELAVDGGGSHLIGDPDQISQIFWNLARNALRAMPGGGTLKIAGRLEGSLYRVAFTDTGIGMTEERKANLFHPFQSFFDGGTGIGMAIVYRIVDEHGGKLSVDSEPNVGTTIYVDLPAEEYTGAIKIEEMAP